MLFRLVAVLWGVFACLTPVSGQPADRVQTTLDRVARFMDAGDLKHAEDTLRQAIQGGAKDSRLYAQLGGILSLQNRLPEASGYFHEALKLNPVDTATRRNLAANQWQSGDLGGAQQNLERILKTRPGDMEARFLLGMVAENRKDYPRAAGLLAAVPDLVAQHPEAVAALARAYYGSDEIEKARNTLAGLERQPSRPEGIFLGGQIAADSHDYLTAERLFASIQSTYPDTAKVGLKLAESQFLADEYAASRKTLTGLIDAGHRSVEIYNLLSWCYERLEDVKGAVRAMDEAIALNPRDGRNYVDLAVMLKAHQVFQVGLQAARRAVEVAPHSAAAWRIKAEIEIKLNSGFEQAAGTYREAIKRNPDSPDFVREFAVAQWDQRLIKEAMAMFEDGIKRFPSDAKLKVDYGRMLLSQRGDDDTAQTRAAALFKAALSLDDALPDAHFELGQLALDESRFQEALGHLKEAARLEPTVSRTHYRLVSVYVNLGRQADADRETALFKQLRAREDRERPGPIHRL